MRRFEAVVSIRCVAWGRRAGNKSATFANRSSVVEEAGRGRQTVWGSDRPGKGLSRTLTTDAMARSRVRETLLSTRW
jgi:hypothetical protein